MIKFVCKFTFVFIWRCLSSSGVIVLFILPPSQHAQSFSISNVSFEVTDQDIVIFYDLNGIIGEEYNVEITLLRESIPDFIHKPKSLSGDIGTLIKSGKNKKIIWNINMEFPNRLVGKDYYFIVETNEIKSNGLWYYISGGVVFCGAVACYLLCEKPPPPELIANPPERP